MTRLTAGLAAWWLRKRHVELARRTERLADRMTANQPASLGPRITVGRRPD